MQGFGNVGAWAGEILTEMGGRVVAVSDATGCVHDEKGLNIKALRCVHACGWGGGAVRACAQNFLFVPAQELLVYGKTPCLHALLQQTKQAKLADNSAQLKTPKPCRPGVF
eukprot:607069-Pelagomonas_calceolata.AAC.2